MRVSGRVTVLTPQLRSDAIELSRTMWRKQILPVDKSIDYKGRKLNFTRDYINNVVDAFKKKAYDAVPLQLADAGNGHNNDPERAAGEVVGLEADADGLYATVSLTDRGSALVREHPNLGVSVRLVEQLERSDGATFPVALQHVLACWDPRISAMKPWQAVECANDAEQVLDLSALTYDFADGETAADPIDQEVQMADQPSPVFSPEQTAALEDMLKKFLPAPAEPETPAEGEYQAPTDEEMARIAAAILAEDDADFTAEVPEGEPVGASLAVDDGEAIELAARLDAQAVELASMRAERDQERYARLVDTLANDHGIPPNITELARPLLHGSHTVELSNGGEVDASEVVRKVMVALADHTRLVDLSRPVAYDSSKAGEEKAAAEKARQDADAYAREFGLV